MILRGANGSPSASQYEIYDIGNNSILAGYSLATIGTDWQSAGLGRFFGSDTTDMILRNGNTGAFELCDIVNNTITSAANLGTVGLDWQVAGVAPVSGAGRSDCVLRNANTGAFEVYDIANNTITSAVSLGAVGLDWQLGGFAVDPPTASAGGTRVRSANSCKRWRVLAAAAAQAMTWLSPHSLPARRRRMFWQWQALTTTAVDPKSDRTQNRKPGSVAIRARPRSVPPGSGCSGSDG
jgi:hypothetical protein